MSKTKLGVPWTEWLSAEPLIFGTESLHAIFALHKTQTRRIIKITTSPDMYSHAVVTDAGFVLKPVEVRGQQYSLGSLGKPGDFIWTREKFWRYKGSTSVHYTAEEPPNKQSRHFDRSFAPIHLPRRDSRLLLTIEHVRVERVQQITPANAIEEGCPLGPPAGSLTGAGLRLAAQQRVEWYHRAWDSLHAEPEYCWNANPWVRVVEFSIRAARQIDLDKYQEGAATK
jgi:hypothetical protein